ncbi:uncharacterized protein LOC8284615 [Ricinus communis]|uniref:uncharacterized protein LOC8284615 n=1 Tax=Ricinus communis TaxID=3988 RepID=UPI00201A5DA0|nr:uncharacterized protein LOC8284615 [Ricinus communis]
MRLLRRIAGFLGFVKDESRDQPLEEEENDSHHYNQPRFSSNFQESGLPRKGFGVPVQVAVDRPQLGPLLVPSSSGDGGVQGLRWYAKRLKIDEDGDVADEFLEEVSRETSSSVDNQHKSLPRFQFKYNARPARIKNQVITNDGKIQQCVEHQGRLQWV